VPIEQVTEATTKIARGEEINLSVTTGDEVEALATAVKRMAEDLKTYQAELVKSAKLATIGEMASEISHEIQNRISGLSLWLQYLDAEVEADDPKREYLEEMKQGLQGFMELLRALKQFYRTPILHCSDVDLNQLVHASLPYVQEQIEARKIELDLQLDSCLPPVHCDADKITSVILNLLVNAVDAVGDGGRVMVQTRNSDLRPQTSDLRPEDELSVGNAVVLTITDNGVGIAEEDLSRIFYPFYSTKAGGSGLGLAIASNLIAAHGGKIEVDSQPGQGTTFTVIFPRMTRMNTNEIREDSRGFVDGYGENLITR
jgi:signal transduction histidine kinase